MDTPAIRKRRALRDTSQRVTRMAITEAELRMVLSWTIAANPTAVDMALDLLEDLRAEEAQKGHSGTRMTVVRSNEQTTTSEE